MSTRGKPTFVSIIVPTHNRPQSLRHTLESLWELDYPDDKIEVIVLDDSSTAGDVVRDFEGTHPIRFVDLPPRYGLQRARNLGISMARGEILCFLDDDVIVQRSWLVNLLKDYGSEQVGGVGGRVASRSFDDFDRHGAKEGTIGVTGHTYLRFKSPNRMEVKFLYGCNMSYRADVLRSAGGFNEQLGDFPYGDDQEIGFRLVNRGIRLVYEPDACVIHMTAKTGGTRAPENVHAYWACRNLAYIRLAQVGGPAKITSTARGLFAIYRASLRRVLQGRTPGQVSATSLPFAVAKGFVSGTSLYLVGKNHS
jgi:GT2 family glycosyltransferase